MSATLPPKQPKRPDRPPKKEIEDWNGDVQRRIEIRVGRVKDLLVEISTLGADIVFDPDDTAAETCQELVQEARRFLAQFDLLKSLQDTRAARKAQAQAVLRGMGLMPPTPTPPPQGGQGS